MNAFMFVLGSAGGMHLLLYSQFTILPPEGPELPTVPGKDTSEIVVDTMALWHGGFDRYSRLFLSPGAVDVDINHFSDTFFTLQKQQNLHYHLSIPYT